MSTQRRAWLQGLGAVAVAAAVAAASLAPPPQEGSAAGAVLYGVPHADLGLHFVGYLALSVLAVDAVEGPGTSAEGRRLEIALAIVLVFGAALEVLQIGVPGRSFSTLDLAANAVGAAVGYGVVGYRWSDRRP